MTHSYIRFGLLLSATAALAQTQPPVTPITPDVMDKYEQTLPSADFIRREEMVPMRDGTKLYTVIVMKKGTGNSRSCCLARPMTRITRRIASPASGSSTSSK